MKNSMKRKSTAPSRALRAKGKVSPNKLKAQIERIDRSDLLSDYDFWPTLAQKTWSQTDVPTKEFGGIERIILAGMGGSLLAGELITDLAREKKSKLQFETIKDYHIPDSCDERSLVVAMSSSGNTEETLSVLSESHKAGIKALAFGTGGALETLSKEKWGFDFIRTSMLKVPRSSLPGMFYPVLKFLTENNLLQVPVTEIDESIEKLSFAKSLVRGAEVPKHNISLQIAHLLLKATHFPLVYSSNRTRCVGLRFRQSINENAKMHAFNGEIPELCHNEIVGWDYRSSRVLRSPNNRSSQKSIAMFLRLRQDDPKEITKRFDIVEEIVRKAGGEIIEAPVYGASYLARIISMLYLLDYVTYYMAILRGIDPIMTPSINLLKQELATQLNYTSLL